MSKLRMKFEANTKEILEPTKSHNLFSPVIEERAIGMRVALSYLAVLNCVADPDKYVEALISRSNHKLEGEDYSLNGYTELVFKLLNAELARLDEDKELLTERLIQSFEWMKTMCEAESK